MNPAQPAKPAEQLRVGGAGVAWRETAGEIVVLDLKASVYFGLNGTAASLWRRLAKSASRADLIEVLQSLGAEPVRASHDVDEFLVDLGRHGLLGSETAAVS